MTRKLLQKWGEVERIRELYGSDHHKFEEVVYEFEDLYTYECHKPIPHRYIWLPPALSNSRPPVCNDWGGMFGIKLPPNPDDV